MTSTPKKPTQAPGVPGGEPKRKKRGCLYWLGVASAVCLVLVVILAGAAWYTYRQALEKPEFYKTRDAFLEKTGAVELDKLSTETERRISDTITQPHAPNVKGGSFELELTFDQLNAWLATRFSGWARHQGLDVPTAMKGVMVTEDKGDLIFAAEVDDPQYKGVVSARVHLELVDKGKDPSLVVKLVSVQSGNVAISDWVIRSMLSSNQAQGAHGQEVQHWMDQLNKGWKLPGRSVLDAKSNREIRIDDLQVNHEGVKVKLTEINGKSNVMVPAENPVVLDPAKSEPRQ
jgi:hypothetical protein